MPKAVGLLQTRCQQPSNRMPASISASLFQRKGEDYNNMEQISIIERFPYPFQVSFHCTSLLVHSAWWQVLRGGAQRGITASVPGVTQLLGDTLLLSTLHWGSQVSPKPALFKMETCFRALSCPFQSPG